MNRFIKHLASIVIPAAVIAMFAASFLLFPKNEAHATTQSDNGGRVTYLYTKIKDTIYLLCDNYISISLRRQRAYLHSRDGEDFSFPVSSGNGGLRGGMNTPTGLYSVQSKTPVALSKQFNNCELTDWVGFNGNIGFHGLKGSRYYGTLGVRPSSHGCVRMSHEDGKKLYPRIHRGTPVFVFSEEPAMIVKFADSTDYDEANDMLIERKDRATDLMMQNRINALYTGSYYHYADKKLFLDGTAIIKHHGFRIGSASNIADHQQLPPIRYRNLEAEIDATAKFTLIKTPHISKDVAKDSANTKSNG